MVLISGAASELVVSLVLMVRMTVILNFTSDSLQEL